MPARIFISYRTADGVDKATALARELGERFGDEQVFLDKDDLRGGSSWRDEVGRALGAKPVLLLLLTPQVFTAKDHAGALRIDDPNDPVRREFAAALEADAQVIPLCCDGVESPPADLPPPFDRIGDYTWRRLRAYDWRNDFQRIVEDLQALGLQAREPKGTSDGSGTGSTTRVSMRWLAIALGVAAIATAAALAWKTLHRDDTPPAPPGPVAITRAGLPGTWIATVAADAPFPLTLQLEAEGRLVLVSAPVPIDDRAGWARYRDFWLRLTGTPLTSIVYRGQGTVITDPGVPLAIDIAWKLYNGAGDTMIDSGNLHANVAADGHSLDGKLWSNGDQADKPIVLRRP